MSQERRGLGAAPGVAVGIPWVHRPVARGSTASASIDDAAATAADELGRLADRLRAGGRDDEAAILDAQALMAADEELLGMARDRSAAGGDLVEAMLAAGDAVASVFAAMDDELLAARAADVRDVAGRIARHLGGVSAPRLDVRSIVVAIDLPPSITVELDRDLLAGIALEGGSPTSHAAILARALGIPAVVGVRGLLDEVEGASCLAVDGASGRVVIDPDPATRAELDAAAAEATSRRVADAAFADRPLTTSDGHRVLCFANVAEPAEIEAAMAAGAEGIGLFRTEFAFAGRTRPPSEDDQAEAYERVLRAAGDAPVVMRMADVGGDKPLPYLPIQPEENPFLGVRALRLDDLHPDLFPTQLVAMLRASARAERAVSIMAPMVADADDVSRVRELVAAAHAAVPDAPRPRVGIMIEIPSAALLADQLAEMVDFMSIGTNDLTQYLLAADRTNPALAGRQDGLHPAVLRAVARVVEGAARAGGRCEVAVCGELAGDPAGALILVGLGVEELSMGPGAFGAVKRAMASRTREELATIASRALQLRTAAEVRAMVAP